MSTVCKALESNEIKGMQDTTEQGWTGQPASQPSGAVEAIGGVTYPSNLLGLIYFPLALASSILPSVGLL